MVGKRLRFSSALVGIGAAAILAASALAQQSILNFDIPAESLSDALRDFGRESGRQIVFTDNLVANRQAPALHGNYIADAALALLLSGTGLSVQPTPGGALMIEQTPVAPTTPRPAEPPRHEASLSEVTVTAARHTQNLQKVSAAVNVVSGDTITQQGLSNIQQILSDVPSMQTSGGPGGFTIDIRGQGNDLPAGAVQGAVALEFDNIYNINAEGSTIGFFDVDRIEALSGPQSTRYGPDADGGVVNVITKDPVIGSAKGNFSLTVGNYDLVRAELAQNIPINDVLALRVAGTAIYRGSYFSPATGNNVGQAARAKLLYQPNDELRIKLAYEIDHIGGTGDGTNLFPNVPNKVAPYLNGSINDGNPWSQGDTASNGVSPASSQSHLYQNTLSLNVGYNLADWVTVDETAALVDIVGSSRECVEWPPTGPSWGPWSTGAPHTCYNVHAFAPFHQYSSETRLHNPAGMRVTWDAGFYRWNYVSEGYGSGGPFGSQGQTGFNETTTNAVFGEVTYPILPSLRVIAGLRESFDHSEGNFGYDNGGPTPDFGIDIDHFDYRAGFEYDLTPHSMEYLTISTGYRPGGLAGLTDFNNQYGAQTIGDEVNTAFEFGTKNRLFGNRLQLNADIFYYIQNGYQDIDKYSGFNILDHGQTINCNGQDEAEYPACITPTMSLQAHNLGLEGSLRYLLTPADQIGDNFTFLQAYFDKKQKGPCATEGVPAGESGVCLNGYVTEAGPNAGALAFFDIAGQPQPHAPKFATTVSYKHTFTLSDGALALGGEAFYTTGYYTNPVLTAYAWQPAYVMGNVTVNFTPSSGRWSLTGYIRNVSNYAVKEAVLPITMIGDPRTYGVTVSYNW